MAEWGFCGQARTLLPVPIRIRPAAAGDTMVVELYYYSRAILPQNKMADWLNVSAIMCIEGP